MYLVTFKTQVYGPVKEHAYLRGVSEWLEPDERRVGGEEKPHRGSGFSWKLE